MSKISFKQCMKCYMKIDNASTFTITFKPETYPKLQQKAQGRLYYLLEYNLDKLLVPSYFRIILFIRNNHFILLCQPRLNLRRRPTVRCMKPIRLGNKPTSAFGLELLFTYFFPIIQTNIIYKNIIYKIISTISCPLPKLSK